MKVGCIIQSRLDSTRLCHKVFRPIGDRTVLDCVIDAAMDSGLADEVVVTTPDVAIVRYVEMYSVWCWDDPNALKAHLHEGPRDPLKEYYDVASSNNFDTVIRLTADCPMLTGEAIDSAVEEFVKSSADYGYNQTDGCDVEVFTFAALEEARANAGPDEHEHVSTWIRKHKRFVNLAPPASKIPFKSLDTQEDYIYICGVLEK